MQLILLYLKRLLGRLEKSSRFLGLSFLMLRFGSEFSDLGRRLGPIAFLENGDMPSTVVLMRPVFKLAKWSFIFMLRLSERRIIMTIARRILTATSAN